MLLQAELLTEHTVFQAEVKGKAVDLILQATPHCTRPYTQGTDAKAERFIQTVRLLVSLIPTRCPLETSIQFLRSSMRHGPSKTRFELIGTRS